MVKISPYALPGRSSIPSAICEAYGIGAPRLFMKTKKREVAEARFVYYLLMLMSTKMTLKEAGMTFGHGHCTVVHAVKMCQNLYKTNKSFRQRIERIIRMSGIDSNVAQQTQEFLKTSITLKEFKRKYYEQT